ncbi:hypothetical protein L1987_06583 [Smallanthus sonchifolius]|uniref:Uncharacterized protein n=1 Tax=Smallanthus sonchifolius TaxID=185202 RepID=A0ACB9JYN7_9ASTR|nr:hypothetical protein L1987_06583 [Smallanthus sonchifolius]
MKRSLLFIGEGTLPAYLSKYAGFGHAYLIIYVDDVIYGSTNEALYKEFEQVMKLKFEVSLMGKMQFFMGLQVEQSESGILIHQAKYVKDILTKFKMTDCKSAVDPRVSQIVTCGPDLCALNKCAGQTVHAYLASMQSILAYLLSTQEVIPAHMLSAQNT